MARRYFDPESLAWKPFGWIGEIVILSLLWGVCCLPVITIGTATTALYDTVVHVMRRRDDDMIERFFGTFKKELKSGIFSTLLWIAVGVLVYLFYRVVGTAVPLSPIRNTAMVLYHILVPFFLLCIFCWVFPLLSRFTFDTAALNATALRLAFGHILRSIAMALLTAGAVIICWLFSTPVIFLPGLVVWLWSFLIEPVFRGYEKGSGKE